MFRSREDERPSNELADKYFRRSTTPLQKTLQTVSSVAGSLYTYIQRPFSYVNSIIRSRSQQPKAQKPQKPTLKETKQTKMAEKRKRKRFCDFNEDYDDSDPEPNNSTLKESESVEANPKVDSSEIEASSLSRRQNFSSYLVEIPPQNHSGRKRVKKGHESEEDIRWRIFTQKTLQQFREWNKNAQQSNEKSAENVEEEHSPENDLKRFKKGMRVPRQRPVLDGTEYKQFIKEKLPRLINVDKAINFLVERENEERRAIQERKQKEIEKKEQEKEKLESEEKKELLPNPFSGGLFSSQVQTDPKPNQPPKLNFGLSQEPNAFFQPNTGSSQLFGGFNLQGSQSIEKKPEQKPISNVGSKNDPPLFLFNNNISKKESQKSNEISLMNIPTKNQEEKEKKQEKEEKQGVKSLKKRPSEQKKPEEQKMPEISVFSKKKSSENKQESEKKSQTIENPFMSKSPAKKLNLNEVLADVDKKSFFQPFKNSEEPPKNTFFSTPDRNIFASNQPSKENPKPQDNSQSGMEIQADEVKKAENQPQMFGNVQPNFFSPSQQQQSFMNPNNSGPLFGGSVFNTASYNANDAKMMFQQSPGQSMGLFGDRRQGNQGSYNNKRKNKDKSVRVYN